jgi:rare lipoprotein A
MGTTYEYLYTGCYFGSESYKSKSNVTIIATVTTADIALLGLNAWEIAYQWANAIRGYVNGWNCSKDSTGTTLIANGYIPNLIPVTGNWSGSATAISATRYGTGETQPNFSTANGDIFHTCDLVVARPSNTTSTWSLNKWIKITYNNKSVVARIVDTSNIASIDLSGGGVAYALNFPGSGNVTVSAP